MTCPFACADPERTFAAYEQDHRIFLGERKKRQGRVLHEAELTLQGDEYQGVFHGRWTVGKRYLGSNTWEEMVYWQGTGSIEGPQPLRDFLFTTQFYADGNYSQGANRFNLEEDLIQFFTEEQRFLIQPDNFLNHKGIVDLALSKAVDNKGTASTRASSFLNPPNIPLIYPACLDLEELQRKSLVKNPVLNADIQYMFYHLIR